MLDSRSLDPWIDETSPIEAGMNTHPQNWRAMEVTDGLDVITVAGDDPRFFREVECVKEVRAVLGLTEDIPAPEPLFEVRPWSSFCETDHRELRCHAYPPNRVKNPFGVDGIVIVQAHEMPEEKLGHHQRYQSLDDVRDWMLEEILAQW